MEKQKLCMVMVGLPARGKSTIANKLKENLVKDGVKTRIFNNGDLRRRLDRKDTSYADFYNPQNQTGLELREKIALTNIRRADRYLSKRGQISILDATNVGLDRRREIIGSFQHYPILFIECINNDEEILNASIMRKTSLPEFRRMGSEEAVQCFVQRINYYKTIYEPLRDEKNYIRMDSLDNKILEEEISEDIPYYEQIRDFLVSDTVKNLFLIRHGETFFNLENRIGGDSCLTEKGEAQAEAMARHFKEKKIPMIFTSKRKRTIETAEPIKRIQENCTIVSFEAFNEIDSGICEGMSYEEIREQMPQVYLKRKEDKYNYVYPEGEGYTSMKERVDKGIKKALYLSSNSKNIMIIGHRAINRMILSHFLYRRTEDVPYIYVPQDKYYHIVATQDKKLFQLKKYY
ncbi:MAG: 6-phosphofructo-2-kinase/fructose-2,6-bisphosphatase [Desulfatiglans sp.]|jgi:broad specificity phosphatase PhoE/GTPase SAR1 family protein|nr:6-phosphofructo-2-kinase/fructose-2,6-bisphosphatase [Thermodesulfobacteriota bacterium]MEE4353815.1 6-phosphofructo-2-kinase/fructose-2,6-bisphosphatase [Desulfatiglans sp.]